MCFRMLSEIMSEFCYLHPEYLLKPLIILMIHKIQINYNKLKITNVSE